MNQKNKAIFRTLFLSLMVATAVFALFGSVFQLRGATSSEQYLPIVRLDPTPTPTNTPTPTPTSTPSCTPPNTTVPEDSVLEQNLAREILIARYNAERNDIVRNWQLDQVAQQHLTDMVTNNFIDHKGSDDRYAQDRMRENCYYPDADQEIVWGGNSNDPKTVIDSWLANDSWNNALLGHFMDDFGVAYRTGGENNTFDYYFVVNIARPISNERSQAADQGPACELTLENEHGQGNWRIYDATLCQELGIE